MAMLAVDLHQRLLAINRRRKQVRQRPHMPENVCKQAAPLGIASEPSRIFRVGACKAAFARRQIQYLEIGIYRVDIAARIKHTAHLGKAPRAKPVVVAGTVGHILSTGRVETIEVIIHHTLVRSRRHKPHTPGITAGILLAHLARAVGRRVISDYHLVVTIFLRKHRIKRPPYSIALIVAYHYHRNFGILHSSIRESLATVSILDTSRRHSISPGTMYARYTSQLSAGENTAPHTTSRSI